ncbi:hypothetical protein ACFQJD_15360 [Haloplanus sp. GCM10025708]|uniref:hypothetical protein n=1 Tax=Haloferacaceae TaxID=1644056 RepID=UPI00360BC984
MATLTAVISRLLSSIVDLAVIFLTDVALTDPISFVIWAVGAGLTTIAVAYFSALVLGGLAAAAVDAI